MLFLNRAQSTNLRYDHLKTGPERLKKFNRSCPVRIWSKDKRERSINFYNKLPTTICDWTTTSLHVLELVWATTWDSESPIKPQIWRSFLLHRQRCSQWVGFVLSFARPNQPKLLVQNFSESKLPIDIYG